MVTTKLKCRNNLIAHNIYKVCNFIQLFSVVEGMPFSTGCFMGVDKNKFFELGGFDETLHFAEDYHLSRKIKRRKFWILINSGVYTDDRRFQKMGYFGLMKEFIRIMRNRYKNDDEFRKDIGYWS
jgi:hypothetical protein